MGNNQGERGGVRDTADTLDLMAFRRLPRDQEHRELLAISVTGRLEALFREELSRKECEALDAGNAPNSVLMKFDEFIIRQAGTFGWRIYLSHLVMARIAQWWELADNGPELFKRLGHELERGARVMRGEGTFPITDRRWYEAKDRAKKELRLLLRQYKSEFNQRRSQPSYDQVCEWFRQKITESPRAFPFLHTNLECLLRYFEYTKRYDETRLRRIALGEVGPAELFDAMAACSWNVSEETARQSISRLASSKL